MRSLPLLLVALATGCASTPFEATHVRITPHTLGQNDRYLVRTHLIALTNPRPAPDLDDVQTLDAQILEAAGLILERDQPGALSVETADGAARHVRVEIHGHDENGIAVTVSYEELRGDHVVATVPETRRIVPDTESLMLPVR